MSKKQKPKRFKIFYFPKPDDPYYFYRTEIITANNEAEAEEIFRCWYHYQIEGNETFFGWIEEIDA